VYLNTATYLNHTRNFASYLKHNPSQSGEIISLNKKNELVNVVQGIQKESPDKYFLHRVAKYRALYVTNDTYSLVTAGLYRWHK
jgi:hypothetical protein